MPKASLKALVFDCDGEQMRCYDYMHDISVARQYDDVARLASRDLG